MKLPYAEPFKTKMVEPIRRSSREEREQWIAEANYNLFNLKSDQVFIDLLTDSGTGAMSDRQWSEIMLGDESYAGASSFHKLKSAIEDITGFPYILPTHQGRAAENVLFSVLIKEGDIIPGNSHFDTTKGHIEFRKARAIDCTCDIAFDTRAQHPFKGNVDIKKLEQVFRDNPVEKIPFVILTLTNNTAGGQPVSMENIRQTCEIVRRYGTRLIIDSARFAENAYFIKTREEGYSDKSIREIVREIFSCADGMTMSAKKDAIVNMGGFIALRDREIYRAASQYNIIFEGFLSYGGLSGRDMNALARGLYEGTEFEYLESRTRQVALLGNRLLEYGIPIQEPVGGHAVFVNALEFYPGIPREEFPAQALAIELYLEAGIRGVEIGAIMADRDPLTRENRYPALELVRLAVPRRVYSDNHMEYIAAALKNIFDRRESVTRGVAIIEEAPLLRHFTVKLQKL